MSEGDKFRIVTGAHWPEGEVRYIFHCPGCECGHYVRVAGPQEPIWKWNGDVKKPTVSPSILIRSQFTCHSFVRDGRIEFCSDSTHKLSGQTVDLPDCDPLI
jgi:hypothetical protein